MSRKSRERREKWEAIAREQEFERAVSRGRFFDYMRELANLPGFEHSDAGLVMRVITRETQQIIVVGDEVLLSARNDILSGKYTTREGLLQSLPIMQQSPFEGVPLFIDFNADEAGIWAGVDIRPYTAETTKIDMTMILIYAIEKREWQANGGSPYRFECGGLVAHRDTDGKIVDILISDRIDKTIGAALLLTAFSALKTLAFMTCQNIELIDSAPNPEDSNIYRRTTGQPMTKFKVLRVTPTSKRYERDDKPQEQFDVMPLHIRRGNFATYSEDAPLFGKYTGTFWRPATAVGDAKNGTVVKDYKIGTLGEEINPPITTPPASLTSDIPDLAMFIHQKELRIHYRDGSNTRNLDLTALRGWADTEGQQ